MKLTVSNFLSTYAYTYTYLHMPARKNTQGKSFKSAFNSLLLRIVVRQGLQKGRIIE